MLKGLIKVMGVLGTAWLVACSALPSGSAPTVATPTPTKTAPASQVIDGRVEVDSVGLVTHCVGEGSPAVILDAGFGNQWLTWNQVLPEVEKFTRVCAFDRPGEGGSDLPNGVRTVRDNVQMVHTWLQKINLRPPYVVAGHSLGGMEMRLYASTYPNEIVGVVLVDAVHPDNAIRKAPILPPPSTQDSVCLRAIRN
ncbi:MAG: alpha/beta hydrolase, partial [Chloroflexi bacterium]|nr:alpha/beta hydrolase [Chloroflexota bacterium]